MEKQDNGTFGFEIQVGSFQNFQTFNEDSGTSSIMIVAKKEGNQDQGMMETVIFIRCAVVLVVLYCFCYHQGKKTLEHINKIKAPETCSALFLVAPVFL